MSGVKKRKDDDIADDNVEDSRTNQIIERDRQRAYGRCRERKI